VKRPAFAPGAGAPGASSGKPAEAHRTKAARLKGLAELKSVRVTRSSAATSAAEAPSAAAPAAELTEFREAVRDVTPLARRSTHRAGGPPAPRAQPHPAQRERDNRAVLAESVADDAIGLESLLETDASLSYRRNGISADTLRKLRRGFWVVQAELDLHGHRVAEAHEALSAFLREADQHGLRCLRVVHGKGRGSLAGVPVLKGKVRSWLARRQDVIAFCQAPPADGGAGALLVLLKPSSG
jgi:DNA-nicking Smr family endonuclease